MVFCELLLLHRVAIGETAGFRCGQRVCFAIAVVSEAGMAHWPFGGLAMFDQTAFDDGFGGLSAPIGDGRLAMGPVGGYGVLWSEVYVDPGRQPIDSNGSSGTTSPVHDGSVVSSYRWVPLLAKRGSGSWSDFVGSVVSQ